MWSAIIRDRVNSVLTLHVSRNAVRQASTDQAQSKEDCGRLCRRLVHDHRLWLLRKLSCSACRPKLIQSPHQQWATLFMRFDYMICPCRDLATSAFSDITCDPNPAFLWREVELPSWIPGEPHVFHWAPFQLHTIVMAIFASLVAPFGGFFASGFKRAFGIKDFGDLVPGHGGMTDRMDCQSVLFRPTRIF